MDKEVKEAICGTETKVAEKSNEKVENLIGKGKYNICAPLFLMFAEYLGYVGPVLKWVDDWCLNKKKPEPYKVKFIEVEAVVAFNECKKKYTEQKMRELYDSLYEVILFLYDENLAKVEAPEE